MPTNPTNKDQNSVFSRINYLEKQKNDPKRTEKEIKVLDLRIDNLYEMLRDDQEQFNSTFCQLLYLSQYFFAPWFQ